jgi:hypothetical protein
MRLKWNGQAAGHYPEYIDSVSMVGAKQVTPPRIMGKRLPIMLGKLTWQAR